VNQRRRTPRIAFVAPAELCDKKWDRQLTAQVRELSAYGCYLGTLNTLPVANTVLLKIFVQSECFEAMAKVIYTHRNRGMGLLFQELSLQSGNLLREWLLKSLQGGMSNTRGVALNR
jgi:PilZ domain